MPVGNLSVIVVKVLESNGCEIDEGEQDDHARPFRCFLSMILVLNLRRHIE